MEYPNKEIYYHEYCHKCVHERKEEEEDPCCDCLSLPIGQWTHKPFYFEEKETNK